MQICDKIDIVPQVVFCEDMIIKIDITIHGEVSVNLANKADIQFVVFYSRVVVSQVSKSIDNDTEEKVAHYPNYRNVENNVIEESRDEVPDVEFIRNFRDDIGNSSSRSDSIVQVH